MYFGIMNAASGEELPLALAQAEGQGGNFLIQIIPFIAIFAIMYFLIIRPQQKRMKAHRQMVENIRRGDEVITQGGIFAKITRVKEGDQEVEAEIAEGVKIRLVKATIADVVSKTEPVGEETSAS